MFSVTKVVIRGGAGKCPTCKLTTGMTYYYKLIRDITTSNKILTCPGCSTNILVPLSNIQTLREAKPKLPEHPRSGGGRFPPW